MPQNLSQIIRQYELTDLQISHLTHQMLAEMLGRNVILPGKDYTHQLDLIFNVLGSPTDDDLRAGYSSRSIHYIRTALPSRTRTPWRNIFPKTSEESLSLLDRLLNFNMVSRITVEDALQHEFVQLWTGSDQGSRGGVSTGQNFLDCGDTEVDARAKREYNMTWAFCDDTLTFVR